MPLVPTESWVQGHDHVAMGEEFPLRSVTFTSAMLELSEIVLKRVLPECLQLGFPTTYCPVSSLDGW